MKLEEFLTKSQEHNALTELYDYETSKSNSKKFKFEFENTDLFSTNMEFLNPFGLSVEEKKQFLTYQRKIPIAHFLDRLADQEDEGFTEYSHTLRNLKLLWGSWNIELMTAMKFPTLAGFWSDKNKRPLPAEFREYSIIEPTFNKRRGLLLFKFDYLGLNKYIPFAVRSSKDWKVYSYFPLLTFKVNFKNKKVAARYGRGETVK